MQRNYKKVAEIISKDCESWMRQFSCVAPAEIARRRENGRKTKSIVQTILGLFTPPQLGGGETAYIFEGLRNKEYMNAFNPESVIVVGSHIEKIHAKSHGYRFCWSFPITSSVSAKMQMGLSYPLIQNLKYWEDALSKFKHVIFFLYEDTQPLGVFFVHLARMLSPKTITVCIQHGIFYKTKSPIRIDGELSDINFVWNSDQVDVIGCDRSKTFEIGLPYVATATPKNELIVVLVGTGMTYFGNDHYNNSLNVFSAIYKALSDFVDLKVFYRPHPNEWTHIEVISELRERFPLLDETDKIQRLNGPRAVFIGTISSLLYEAGVAGHIVAHLKIYDEVTSSVSCDFSFGSDNIDDLVEWVTSVRDNQCAETRQQNFGQPSPVDRFIYALYSAMLID